LVNTKLGDAKPLLSEQTEEANITKSIQCFLNKRMNAGLAVDGLAGSNTSKAIEQYQSNLGVFPADGVWGPQTKEKMPPKDKQMLEECVNEHSDIIDKVLRWFGL
jgi:peptidoglycan hydrolase-like protein with peptidoglycan-binding domain